MRLFSGYFDVRLAVVLHTLYIILLNNFNCEPELDRLQLSLGVVWMEWGVFYFPYPVPLLLYGAEISRQKKGTSFSSLIHPCLFLTLESIYCSIEFRMWCSLLARNKLGLVLADAERQALKSGDQYINRYVLVVSEGICLHTWLCLSLCVGFIHN